MVYIRPFGTSRKVHNDRNQHRAYNENEGRGSDRGTDVFPYRGEHCRASVRWFGPATNSVSTTSSNDVAKAKTAPDTIPGSASGKVTCFSILTGAAPRLAAACSNRRSIPCNTARTLTTTKGTATTVWAMITPRVRKAWMALTTPETPDVPLMLSGFPRQISQSGLCRAPNAM